MAVVAASRCRAAPVDVAPLVEAQDRRVCVVLDAVTAFAFQGLAPPVDASPEELAAVRNVNADLAQMREMVQGLPSVRELGC